jgi:endoglucanase
MKPDAMKLFSALFFSLFISFQAFNQERLPAFALSERLGRGINMGNMFEAPTETEWGNPWKKEYFEIISSAGFNHVRLPVRWETSARSLNTYPYTISTTFLARIQEVVDEALKNKLHIIINMHHHDALFENPANNKARFLAQWEQIANHFKDYPDSLLFEVLNEPHGNLTPTLWNEFFDEALNVIRVSNPSRGVVLGVAEFGGLSGIPQIVLPNDEYILLSPHYYNPFTFTHQGADWADGSASWLGTEWLDTESERETIKNEFSYALAFSEANHIPIYVGEFGAYEKADLASRVRWTNFLARWFEEKKLSWAYWEFSAGFGIYNPNTKTFNQNLVNALLHTPMQPFKPVYSKILYQSNFSTTTDGWSLGTQGGATGNLKTANESLEVTINNGGTQSWHIQLTKGNFKFEKGKMYRISFDAYAVADRSVTFYAGKASDPWNVYGSASFTITPTLKNYSNAFTMTSTTDAAARLVFDLGLNTNNATITNIKVEELSFTPSIITNIEERLKDEIVYPNPTTGSLYVKNPTHYFEAKVYDLRGKIQLVQKISTSTTEINLNNLPAGIYILQLLGKSSSKHVRIVKRE